MGGPDQPAVIDGVRLAVLTSRFEGVVRAMMNTLLRSGRSGVLNTARDFSCAVITKDCELLATADSVPIHVMSGADLQARSMLEFHPRLRAGDAFIHNSPYHGNSHAADQTILVPVVDDEGVHRFTVLSKAHQADIGNSVPTTYYAAARDVYEEGALIFPSVKIQEDYRDVDDVIRMCRLRMRAPEQWWGDYLAALGAARIGERRIRELADELGWAALDDYVREWFDYSERRMVDVIRGLPAGRVTTHGLHDPFPGVPDGVPVTATVEIDPGEAVIEIDLRDNIDNVPCGLNLTEACTRTAAMIGVFNGIGPGVPANAGSFRRLRILLREGAVVGIPEHPFSCSASTTNVADRVGNAVQRALGEIGEGIGQAECGAVLPPSLGVISGRDPRADGKPFVSQVFLGFTAGAGTPWSDAWLTICHQGNAGLILIDSVEMDEARFPIHVHRRSLVPDTEGPGRYRGAPSAYVEYGPVDTELEVFYASDGHQNPARGVRGGGSGGPSQQWRRDRAGELHELAGWQPLVLEPGERIVSLTAAGGGYGDPRERDPERVAGDVREGLVSPERAADAYAVILDADGNVDGDATRDARAKRKEGLA